MTGYVSILVPKKTDSGTNNHFKFCFTGICRDTVVLPKIDKDDWVRGSVIEFVIYPPSNQFKWLSLFHP